MIKMKTTIDHDKVTKINIEQNDNASWNIF